MTVHLSLIQYNLINSWRRETIAEYYYNNQCTCICVALLYELRYLHMFLIPVTLHQ